MAFVRAAGIVIHCRFHAVGIARPAPPCNAAHNVPAHGGAYYAIHPFAAVQHQPEAAVYGLAYAHASAVMQRAKAHAARGVARKALHRHIRHNV